MSGRILKGLAGLVFLALIIYGALYLGHLARENVFIQETVQRFGYLGIFVVSLISGFNLAVPIPAISFLPLFLESGLSASLTVVIITLGMTVADSLAYFVGRVGRNFVDRDRPLVKKLSSLEGRYRFAPVVILALWAVFMPLPNEILTLPLGFLGFRLKHLVLPLLFGNAVFNTLSAFGVVKLFDLL